MEINYLAIMLLAAAFAFIYASKRYPIKYDLIWQLCAVLCAAAYAAVMLAGGESLLTAAAGLCVLLFGALSIGDMGERKNAV